ncbi:MAG TPA: PEP-utilizing enzyme [Kofleriaceae bacterium]|jgi:pyruvate,water dikinase
MSREDSTPPAEWVHSLADVADDPRCGGKARGLAKLIAAGQPVPPGIVIDSRAFASFVGPLTIDGTSTEPNHDLSHRLFAGATVPPALLDEVRRHVAAPLLAVRSSATIEDAAAGAGAGLFSSKTAVAQDQLAGAILFVWQSALSAAVAAYARRRDAAVEIAVIVQPFIEGEPITVYTRPPGAPAADEVLVQRGSSLERISRISAQWMVCLALRAEAAIGATDGADVEMIQPPDGGPLTIVQARPIIHPTKARRMPMPAPLLAALVADGRKWTWDVTHNPDPLSVAQAELVERVERAGVAPFSLRSCSGYLYSAALDSAMAITLPENITDDDLEVRVTDIEQRLASALGLLHHPEFGWHSATEDRPGLDEAVARYVAFYKIWTNELSPLIGAARRRVAHHDVATIERPSSIEGLLKRAAVGELTIVEVLKHVGDLAPAWDVAVPTYSENPRLILEAVSRARALLAPHLSPLETTEIRPQRSFSAKRGAAQDAASTLSASLIADLAERDDQWFARAQFFVRSRLMFRGIELGLEKDDVYWLPFDELIAGIDADTARRRAAGARAAMARAAQWDPPLVVHGGIASDATRDPSARELRGVAGGVGRAVGRVVRYASLASAVMAKPGDVIVARAITPALAVMVIGCAAIVSETGGLLDHGAAMARELGIPCVVGCTDAWRVLEDGALVEVDGDAGVVRMR